MPRNSNGSPAPSFQHAFKIAPESTKLYIRDLDITETHPGSGNLNIPVIETLLSDHENGDVLKSIAERGILVQDEMEFDNFYEATDVQTRLVQLLKTTDSCIFLPLYEQNIHCSVHRGSTLMHA